MTLDAPENRGNFSDQVAQAVAQLKPERIIVTQPGEWRVDELVRDWSALFGLPVDIVPDDRFMCTPAAFRQWAQGRKQLRMEYFYRDMRRQTGLLMDGDQPVGGKWNYDADNRESPPKGHTALDVAPPYWPSEDDIDADVRRDIDAMNLDTVGVDGPRLFAVTPAEADAALSRFVTDRLPLFGRYEDAMMGADWAMSHSLLSVPLNLGVLHPLDVVRAAEGAYRSGAAPLAAAEGFIRQILGWREYIWQLYWHFGPDYPDSNSLDAHTALPDWWRDADADAVEAECLRQALAGVRDRGWAHHIQRLMVLGSHALQRGYQPRELNDWFATAFVDGFAWVMPAFDPKKRLGPDACPFTAGYWAFVDRHQQLLGANMRTARAVSSMKRLVDLEAVLDQ